MTPLPPQAEVRRLSVWMQRAEAVLSLSKRDLKARYKESVLGFLWSLLKPAMMTLILWIVFALILKFSPPSASVPYWLHVLVSVLFWNFFVGALMDGTHSVVANGGLLKKVRIDAVVFPASALVAQAVHFVMAMSIVAVIAAFFRSGLDWGVLLAPVAVLGLVLLAFGLMLLLSAIQVYVRDTGSVLEIGTMAWFYLTPIIYPMSMVTARLEGRADATQLLWLYLLNPVAPLMVAFRRGLLYADGEVELPDAVLLPTLGVALAVSAAVFVLGATVFRRMQRDFSDEF